MNRRLHIISFDVPFPANYGGVIDVYYKIKALHQLGWKIVLHCFEYGRGPQHELEKYCETVYYYKRETGLLKLLSSLPYIVNTRKSQALLNNLMADDSPILFEGLHSCALINHALLKDRVKVVRTHNIEHDYYFSLFKSESRLIQKLYFKAEAGKLKRFESVLSYADSVAAISANDTYHFRRIFSKVYTIPAFHPSNKISCEPGFGHFVLYHGNLAVAENDQAARYLVENVFVRIPGINFVIAGSQPSDYLINLVKDKSNIRLMADISTLEIETLVKEAHINVLPTFQATGIKLKLLASLFNGRHCLVNTPMVANTGLENLCHIIDSPELMAKKIKQLMKQPFTLNESEKREHILSTQFSNLINAQKLSALFGVNEQEHAPALHR